MRAIALRNLLLPSSSDLTVLNLRGRRSRSLFTSAPEALLTLGEFRFAHRRSVAKASASQGEGGGKRGQTGAGYPKKNKVMSVLGDINAKSTQSSAQKELKRSRRCSRCGVRSSSICRGSLGTAAALLRERPPPGTPSGPKHNRNYTRLRNYSHDANYTGVRWVSGRCRRARWRWDFGLPGRLIRPGLPSEHLKAPSTGSRAPRCCRCCRGSVISW